MKNFVFKALISSALLISTSFAQTANEIAKKVHDLPSGKTSSYTVSLTLVDKNGKTRNRELVSYFMKEGTTEKTVIVFKTPRDVAGISYLTYDYPDKADGSSVDSDSWIYLPAMKKVRRVSGSSKDDDFQGTDFTYDDLGTRSLNKDNFAILGEEKVNGVDCWILEAKAKDPKAKISRRVSWIDKKTYVTHKGEYYDKQNRLLKTLICDTIKQVKGYWSTQKLTMTNVQSNHKTVYEVKDLKYDEPVNASFFMVSSLERELVK
ncbi:outer membrane lipoprotein-sorting protein [Fibrobacter sp. UWB11]|uniref:outer membrane lipoprotein-sorting protein n=1 Tax=Fibrobacter sp. UWB11 TaxID=1896202 RepID=UPI0009277D25|nr:outer membrane lipoprotein-sorting protein [Fibrobacter sp. UWB11]SIO12483.1 Outer membrane lipoprotein-sorting protein [Fibrobacter sp. UWB11]